MSQTRIKYIDLLRAIAILTVLYCHAVDGIYIINMTSSAVLSLSTKIFQFISLFIGRLGVPFFLMITGYLLLDRKYDERKVRKFWSKNCFGLIAVTLIWIAIYIVSLQFLTINQNISNPVEAGRILFSHMWYMPMIIGIYITIPFVASAVQNFNEKTILQVTSIFIILAFIIPLITTLLEMHGIKNMNLESDLGFSGGIYGVYIILGYLIKKGVFKEISEYTLGIVATVSFMCGVLFQYYTFISGFPFLLWYESPFILLGSFSLFELISRLGTVRLYSGVKFLSKYAFAVFLIHNIYRIPLLSFITLIPLPTPLQTIILWILLIILSYGTAILIYRIPIIGKYILYMENS